MKIALIAPIWERVPPRQYGGTQRVVAGLADTLVERGHDVTLFATGDSRTKARLSSVYPRALYRDGIGWDNYIWPTIHAAQAFERQHEFDVIHYHLDRTTEYVPGLLAARHLTTPIVFTLHFTIEPTLDDAQYRRRFLAEFRELNFVSISRDQRRHLPKLNFVATVHNGIELEKIPFTERPGRSLIWLGRMSPTKGAAQAIEIAKRLDQPLILAGKLDHLAERERQYFEESVKPHIDGRRIRYIGEVNWRQRARLFAKGSVLLNPIQWEEPFGLAPAEAMAAGLPVVAFDRGAMREVVKPGVSGYIVTSVDEAVTAVPRAAMLDRRTVRSYAERHFTYERMTKEYQLVYERLAKRGRHG